MKILITFIAILTLAGCGLKGPLYETPSSPVNDKVQNKTKVEQPKTPIKEQQEH